MENRKRNIQIKFRVTEEERTLIEEKMKQVPTSNMKTYLRKMAIDGYIIQIDHSDITCILGNMTMKTLSCFLKNLENTEQIAILHLIYFIVMFYNNCINMTR